MYLFSPPISRSRVEPTLLPGAGFNTYGYSGLNRGGYGSRDSLAKHSIQSSLFVPVSSEHQRLYFGSPLFLRRIWAYLANDLYRRDDTKRTVTFTRTKIATEREMSTKTNTIGISGCTPSPLPYDVCPWMKFVFVPAISLSCQISIPLNFYQKTRYHIYICLISEFLLLKYNISLYFRQRHPFSIFFRKKLVVFLTEQIETTKKYQEKNGICDRELVYGHQLETNWTLISV